MMDKRVVYHGTTIDRANQILKDGYIKKNDAIISRYEDTKRGFVYVTTQLCDAMDFSTKPEINKDTCVIAVFKIVLEESELLQDEDEIKWQSTLSEDGASDCFKVNRDLKVGEDVIAVFGKRLPSHNALGNYMQAIQFGEKEVKESEWKTLCHD